MTTWRMSLGWGAVLLLASMAAAQDTGSQESDRVAQAGRPRFRTFEGRFGDSDRPRQRPGDSAQKDEARKKPEADRRYGQRHSANPGEQAGKKKDGSQGSRPQWSQRSRPDWRGQWRPSSFQGRNPQAGQRGSFGQFAGRHVGSGFGSHFAAASWRGHHRHKGHGHMGRHGSGLHHRMAWSRHRGHHEHHAFGRHHRGQHGRYAAWGWGRHGHRGHHGGCRGAMAMRGGHGSFGRNLAVARMAALRWHHRGFGGGQFGRQSGGSRDFAMGPWTMRSQWHGFGGGLQVRGPQFGGRPQAHAGGPQFHRPWGSSARPASMPGRGSHAHGGGDASKAQLSNRIERLQRELERLRREAR